MALDSVLTSTHLTATNTVRTGATKVCSVILTPAAALVTAVVRDGGAGGTVLLTLQAAASGNSAVWDSEKGIVFGTDVHVTLTGAGVLCQVAHSPLN